MAYTNFKETIWSQYIEHELPKLTVFEKDCDYTFKGEVGKGKTVKILGITAPAIGNYTGADIGVPAVVDDKSTDLVIDQAKYFNFMVDDIDEAQAKEGLMQAILEESNRALAEERDKYIAKLCAENSAKRAEEKITDKATAKAAIDKAIKFMWDSGITKDEKPCMYLSPEVYMLMFEYITDAKTNNDAALESGELGHYMGFGVKMTNNLFKGEDLKTNLIFKTAKAVAFASGINEVEAYRPEGYFSDAVKGLNTYGGKVVRPNEIYVIAY